MSGATLVPEAGDARCAKCAEAPADGKRKATAEATYTLRRGDKSWRLCLNHACAASHALRIPPFYRETLP
jgi:hypothetical protein